MVSRAKQAEDRAGSRHAAAERQAETRILERGQAGFQRGPRGMAGARVLKAFMAAKPLLCIGRGLIYWCNGRTCGRIRRLAHMNGTRGKMHRSPHYSYWSPAPPAVYHCTGSSTTVP